MLVFNYFFGACFGGFLEDKIGVFKTNFIVPNFVRDESDVF